MDDNLRMSLTDQWIWCSVISLNPIVFFYPLGGWGAHRSFLLRPPVHFSKKEFQWEKTLTNVHFLFPIILMSFGFQMIFHLHCIPYNETLEVGVLCEISSGDIQLLFYFTPYVQCTKFGKFIYDYYDIWFVMIPYQLIGLQNIYLMKITKAAKHSSCICGQI